MKKLFNIGSSIVIDGSSSLRITGPYELVALGPDSAIIKNDYYVIDVSGDELTVDKLGEEMAVFSFDSIKQLKLVELKAEGDSHGA